MNSRSKKYFVSNKAEKDKANKTNDNKKETAPKSSIQKNTATRDDTGGGNDSGKRSDDN